MSLGMEWLAAAYVYNDCSELVSVRGIADTGLCIRVCGRSNLIWQYPRLSGRGSSARSMVPVLSYPKRLLEKPLPWLLVIVLYR